MVTTISKAGRDFIAEHEGGYILKAYLCPARVATISAGVTFYEDGTRVKIGDSISLTRAKELFSNVLKRFEAEVNNMTRDDITQKQFDALMSFAFNVGTNALKRSTLLAKVNKNPADSSIRNEFGKWVYAAGKVSRGLQRRRRLEADMYFS